MKNEIIKKANTTNYSKKLAHAAIIILLNELDFDELDEHRIHLAAIYHQFIPKRPAKPKADFDWVAMAVGEDEVRPYLSYVYADGENLIATTGYRLHCVPDNRENKTLGFHDLKGNLIANQKMNFPTYKGILDAKNKEVERFEMPHIDSLEMCLEGTLQLVKLKEFYFKYEHLSGLLGQIYSNWTVSMSEQGTVFENENGRRGALSRHIPKWEK